MGFSHRAKEQRELADRLHGLGVIAAAQPEEIKARRANAEQAYTNVLSRLGAEGTYSGSESTESAEPPTDLGGSFTETKVGINSPRSGKAPPDKFKTTSYQLNLPAYQQQVEGSTQFRLMSSGAITFVKQGNQWLEVRPVSGNSSGQLQ